MIFYLFGPPVLGCLVLVVGTCLKFNHTNINLDGRINRKPDGIQARKAQLVAYWLGTREVLVSNPGKGENFSVKISNWI